MVLTQSPFQTNCTVAMSGFKTLSNCHKRENTNPHFKKEPKRTVLNYTKLHYLSGVYCQDQDCTLRIGASTPQFLLLSVTAVLTSRERAGHTRLIHSRSCFPGYNRDLTSIKKVKWEYFLSDYKSLLGEDKMIDSIWRHILKKSYIKLKGCQFKSTTATLNIKEFQQYNNVTQKQT